MHILVDITHPAHVHFFRNAIAIWENNGHQVSITTRRKDIAIELLDQYNLKYTNLGEAKSGLIGLAGELVWRNLKLWKIVQEIKPDVMVSISGIFSAQVGWLSKIPAIVFTDTEHATLSNMLTFPFATSVITPDCYQGDIGKKHISYAGYHELAYLHPNRFTPDPSILSEVGLTERDRFFIVRFVSWGASHDVGHHGFSLESKLRLIKLLEQYGKVIISSEGEPSPELSDYNIKVPTTEIHNLLHYATMYIGEGGTMATEAAILGTPSIFVSTLSGGNWEELEHKYQLMHSFDVAGVALEKIQELLEHGNIKNEWKSKREQMLEDKTDVTSFVTKIVTDTISPTKIKLSLHRSRVTNYRRETALSLQGRILDCGSGIGNYLPYLRGDVVCLDRNFNAIQMLDYSKTVNSDATILPFAEDSFDAVWACAVVQYTYLDKFIEEAVRVTKSNGRVFILVPNGKSLWDFFKKVFGMSTWWEQEGIVTQYSIYDLEKYGKITGEVQFLPFENIFRQIPLLGHTLMLEITVNKNKPPLQITLCGACLAGNMGGAALNISMVEGIKKLANEHVDITLLSKYPEDDFDTCKSLNWKLVSYPTTTQIFYGIPVSIAYWIGQRFGLPKQKFMYDFMQAYLDSDMIIDLSGISFTDDRPLSGLVINILWLLPAVITNKKWMKASQAMGPFNKFWVRITSRFFLKQATALVARGRESEKFLREFLPSQSKNIYQLPDVAFILNPAPEEKIKQILDSLGINKPYCVVGPSFVLDRLMDKDSYRRLMAKVVDELIMLSGYNVLLLSHARATSYSALDDLEVCQATFDFIDNQQGTYVLDEPYPVDVLKGIIAQSEIAVGSRFHFMVAAVSSGVPSLAIGWSHKYLEMMRMAGQEKFVVSYQNLDETIILKMLKNIWKDQNKIRQEIDAYLPNIKKQAMINAKIALELL